MSLETTCETCGTCAYFFPWPEAPGQGHCDEMEVGYLRADGDACPHYVAK